MGDIEHLSLFVNGRRLDIILSKKVDVSYLGLIPAWLDYYDDDFLPSQREKQYVWRQTQLTPNPVVLTILLCPDDFDLSCTVIVVEVECDNECVIWNRFGADVTEFDANEQELPKYIGKEIKWFDNVGPYVFSKQDYLSCVSKFPSSAIINLS